MQRRLQIAMIVILGLWLAMLPYTGFAVSFALPNDSTETPDTSIAKRYPYLHFVEKDYGASKDSSNLSDEEFYNRAGRMVFPVNKFATASSCCVSSCVVPPLRKVLSGTTSV